MRAPHWGHNNNASHSGQRRQFFFTSRPHWGQVGAFSLVSQTGHIRHEGRIGSPHCGQEDVDWVFLIEFNPV